MVRKTTVMAESEKDKKNFLKRDFLKEEKSTEIAESEKDLLKVKTSLKDQVTKLMNKLETMNPANPDEVLCKELLERHARTKYKEVQELRARALQANGDEEKLQVFDQDVDVIDDTLLDIEVVLLTLLKSFEKNKSVIPKPNPRSNCDLPDIPLLKFSGFPSDWFMFRDEFQEMIVNYTTLSKKKKLHYLNEALQGDSGSLKLPGKTFEFLWKAVVDRYEMNIVKCRESDQLRILKNLEVMENNRKEEIVNKSNSLSHERIQSTKEVDSTRKNESFEPSSRPRVC